MKQFFGLIFLLSILGCQKPETDYSGIDAQLDQVVQAEKLLGLSVKLFNEKEAIYTFQSGLANVASERAITDSTIFRIASISKTLTAVAVMQLAGQGKLTSKPMPAIT